MKDATKYPQEDPTKLQFLEEYEEVVMKQI